MAEARLGVVVAVRRGTCEVRPFQARDLSDEQAMAPGVVPLDPAEHCVLAGDLAQVQRTAVAVGDRVRLGDRPDAPPLVTEVLPRSTCLSRPDPMDPKLERVIVANVDLVVIVLAAKRPAPKLRLVDRYLVATGRGGADAVLVINKVDLLSPRKRDALAESLAPYRELGVPVHLASAHDNTGLAELRATLAGHTCAMVGHSGVGKSSLLNALMGDGTAAVGDVRTGDGKGRHTTTFSALHDVPPCDGHAGTRIIDTPGIRAFGLWNLSREDLRHYFPEFDGRRCRYADCVHVPEPEADCAVKQAVASGEIARVRYDTYRRMLGELS